MSINTVEYANQLMAENADLKKQIEELTADLDKESEIRHRIHEELNAIKGVLQPVYQIIDDGN